MPQLAKAQPKISIIIYNRDAGMYTVRLLKALQKDPYENLEIIVIDGSSKDNSTTKIKTTAIDYQMKNVKLFSIPSAKASLTVARNLGIKRATGNYLLFLDPEDELDKSFFTALLAVLKANPENTLALTGICENRMKSDRKTYKYLTLTKNRQEKERLGEYLKRLVKTDNRLVEIPNKLFSTKIVKENNLEFASPASTKTSAKPTAKDQTNSDRKFVLGYLRAAKITKVATINKPLLTKNYPAK